MSLPKKQLCAAVLAVAWAAFTVRAAAAEPDSLGTLYWGPEIIVEGFRITPDIEILSSPAFVGLIEIDKARDAMADPSAILSRAVGITVKEYGGLGSFATISIRGSSSTQVQIYRDGVPLNDAYSGMTNLADISLDDVSRIEVYRGFSPAGFGASSIGGTVNLVSSEPAPGEKGAAPRFTAQSAAGSFGTFRHTLSSRVKTGPAEFSLTGGYMKSDGDFDYLDDNATPFNTADDETAVRENNHYSKRDISAKVRFYLPGFELLSISHEDASREGGVPGIGTNQSVSASLSRGRRLTYLKARPVNLASNRVHLDFTAYNSWTAERFEDPGADISLAATETDNRITSSGGNAKARVFLPLVPVSAGLFVEHRYEKFHPVEYLPSRRAGPDRKRRSTTAVLSADIFAFHDRLILTSAYRSEWHENEFYDEPFFPWLPPTPQGKFSRTRQTPSAGFRYEPVPALVIKGNRGKYYRLPTFFEMFGVQGSVTGDSGLEPETGTNSDIGLIWSPKKIRFIDAPYLEIIYLYNEIEDLILFFPNSQSTVRPANIGSARIQGIELSAAGTLAGTLRISGNYCWLDSRDTGPIPYYSGNELPGRPSHEASVALELERAGWTASWEVHHIGSNYLDRANEKEVPARSIHNLILLLRPRSGRTSLTLEGRNLGDDRTSDVSGFPLPGRSWYTSIRIEI